MSEKQFFDFFVDNVKKVYVEIYGLAKWENLTDEEKHGAVMLLAKDLNKVFEK